MVIPSIPWQHLPYVSSIRHQAWLVIGGVDWWPAFRRIFASSSTFVYGWKPRLWCSFCYGRRETKYPHWVTIPCLQRWSALIFVISPAWGYLSVLQLSFLWKRLYVFLVEMRMHMDTLTHILILMCHLKPSKTLASMDLRPRMALEAETPTKLQQMAAHHHPRYPKRLTAHPNYRHT